MLRSHQRNHQSAYAACWRSVAQMICCALVLFWAHAAWAVQVEVEIKGLTPDLAKIVSEQLTLVQHQASPFISDYLVQHQFKRGTAEIERALQAYGYYHPQIEAQLEKQGEVWRAIYNVTLGPPVLVTLVDIRITGEGAEDALVLSWREQFPLQKGAIFEHAVYEKAKAALLTLMDDHGYVEAVLSRHEVLLNTVTNSAEIYFQLETGPRYQFGQVSFLQEGYQFKRQLIARYMDFAEGDPYDANQLVKMQRKMLGSDYFSRADINPLKEQAENKQIPIEIRSTEGTNRRYRLGVGYGTDGGARGLVGYERHWLNAAGHQLSAEWNISEINSDVLMMYRIPRPTAATDFLILSPRWVNEHTHTSSRITRSVTVAITHMYREWLATTAVDVERESYRVGSDSGLSSLVVPRFSLQRIKFDDRFYVRNGWSIAAMVRGASQELASDTSFLQTELRGKVIHSLSENTRVIARVDAGVSWVAEFSELPVSYRYFTGGDNSVRGYAYNILGVRDSSGALVGGRNLLVGSVEMDYMFTAKWGGAIFYDEGNAFNDLDYHPEKGAGVGLRWRMPIAAIHVDVASAISETDQPWRLHLSAGVDL